MSGFVQKTHCALTTLRIIEWEVKMSDWIARYEEGYVTSRGDNVQLVDELRTGRSWDSPREAADTWLALENLVGANVSVTENGFTQVDDVSNRPDFTRLGAVEIWRRVTFVRSQDAGESRT